jgi:hypothetical protein
MHEDGVQIAAVWSDTGPPPRIEARLIASVAERLHSGVSFETCVHALRLGITRT